eukprot:UN10808
MYLIHTSLTKISLLQTLFENELKKSHEIKSGPT